MAEAQDPTAGHRWKSIAEPVAPPVDSPPGVPPPPEPPVPAPVGLGHIGRILIASAGTWLALAAVPGALPWNSADDGDRALVAGAAAMTVIALGSIPISLIWRTGRGAGAAWAGLAASLFGLGFAAVQVARTLVVPITVSRSVVLGVGLLVLLAFAFLLTWRRQLAGVRGMNRLSSLPLLGSILALALIGAYLLLTNTLLGLVKAPAEDWARYLDLRSGLEVLIFGAAGALLGSSIQRQSTDRAATRADASTAAATTNYVVASQALDLAMQGRAPESGSEERSLIAQQERDVLLRELRTQLRLPR